MQCPSIDPKENINAVGGEVMLSTNLERIRERIEILGSFNATPGNGCTRFSYSSEYRKALDFLVYECRDLGLDVKIDGIGNMRARLAGTDPDALPVLTGSHLDTVLYGGNYDGVVGVVGALEALAVLKEQDISLKHPVELIVFIEEEGASFGSTPTGSKALTGRYSTEDLKHLLNNEGISFYDAAIKFGLNPEDICTQTITRGQYKAMLELHIEQSVVLESESIPIGIVQAIAGIKQLKVELTGVPNHAGATPMKLRNDPMAGASRIISFVEDAAKSLVFDTTVGTVGKINCYPNIPNVIPGKVIFSVDIRDVRPEGIERMEELLRGKIAEVCREYGLRSEVILLGESRPIVLPETLVSTLESVAKGLGVPYLKMNSGAVHDSCLLADIMDVGMIFVPSVNGRSHVPEEYTRHEDIKLGCDILLSAILKLAG